MNGIPDLKELFAGIGIDCDETENRHLRQQEDLRGHELYIELSDEDPVVEVVQPEEEEEGEEDEEEESVEEGEDDEDDSGCENHPEGCPTCEDFVCDGPDVFDPCHDLSATLLLREKPNGPWYEITPEWLEERPALCRFLHQIEDVYGLPLGFPGEDCDS